MIILMVTSFPCIRALKESKALKARGHTIMLLCSRRSNNTDWDLVADQIHVYVTDQDFKLLLLTLADKCDIVHTHNEPNTHTAYAAIYINNKPVVYDCHDFTSLRSDMDEETLIIEKYSFEYSDAVIHVSNELCRQADLIYKQKKSLVLYSLPSFADDELNLSKKFSNRHVAYQGGLGIEPHSNLNYRYYLEYFDYLASQNIRLGVFPSEVTHKYIRNIYERTKHSKYISVYKTHEYKSLLYNLSKFEWGFTGFYRIAGETNSKSLYLDHAMPNKLFEYILVGATPIVLNCKEAGNYVTKHNVGYHVNSIEEFADVAKNAPPLAQNMDKSLIDMNIQIEKLEQLYYDLLG